MKKGSIITISIISFIIALSIILFGFVFCVRTQTVTYNSDLSITENSIIEAANIENGSPTLMIDKEKATNNIENKFPNIKVVQIKTTSLMSVEIVVRQRYDLYFKEFNQKYYIFDEELKVLSIQENKPENLIEIKSDLNLTEQTKIASFVGNNTDLYFNLFTSVYSVVITSEDAQARVDTANLIKDVKLENDKMIITTNENVIFEITKPTEELTNKINICFSATEELSAEQKDGTIIKILYNQDGSTYKGYIKYAE